MRPIVAPPDARVVPEAAGRAALDALGELRTAADRLGDPDLFHRPRFRVKVHHREVGSLDPVALGERVAAVAEARAAAGHLAVASVRAEVAEHPDRRPCFDPDSLAELHRLIAAGDPSIPGGGGFRRSAAVITWDDGQRFTIDAAPGRPLRGHLERWHRWAETTTSPPLDAAALGMVQLFTIHPFPDANGRVARLLAQCDLIAAGLMPGLLLDLEGWVHGHRRAFDEAVVAAADGDLPRWGALFARAVAETARHRTGTVAAYRTVLDAAAAQAADDPDATAVLAAFLASPAVSADWLTARTGRDLAPALARLLDARVLTPHPRLPGAAVHADLIALLDAPYTP